MVLQVQERLCWYDHLSHVSTLLSSLSAYQLWFHIEHINKYNTGHSESIITNDYNASRKFLDEIDALCPPRDRANATSSRLCSLLLALFDEVSERVVVIGATNR